MLSSTICRLYTQSKGELVGSGLSYVFWLHYSEEVYLLNNQQYLTRETSLNRWSRTRNRDAAHFAMCHLVEYYAIRPCFRFQFYLSVHPFWSKYETARLLYASTYPFFAYYYDLTLRTSCRNLLLVVAIYECCVLKIMYSTIIFHNHNNSIGISWRVVRFTAGNLDRFWYYGGRILASGAFSSTKILDVVAFFHMDRHWSINGY